MFATNRPNLWDEAHHELWLAARRTLRGVFRLFFAISAFYHKITPDFGGNRAGGGIFCKKIFGFCEFRAEYGYNRGTAPLLAADQTRRAV